MNAIIRANQRLFCVVLLAMAAGCQPGSLFPSTFLRKPHGPGMPAAVAEFPPPGNGAATAPTAQPMLLLPTVGNPVQTSVFDELADLREEHGVIQTSLGTIQERATKTREDLDAESANLKLARTELQDLQDRVSQLNYGLQRCQRELDQLRRQQNEQQARDVETLDELNRTVDSLLEQARSIGNSQATGAAPVPAPAAATTPSSAPVPAAGPMH